MLGVGSTWSQSQRLQKSSATLSFHMWKKTEAQERKYLKRHYFMVGFTGLDSMKMEEPSERFADGLPFAMWDVLAGRSA